MNVFDISFKGGTFINDNLIALSSNRALPGGEDILILYDPTNNKKIDEIKNYCFILSNYVLELIPINEKLKILLCACKKYFKDQKNGILLNFTLKKKIEISYKFEETNNFEIFFFGQF